jgi:CubicO group peptidase (beta-lactamase class C family)
MKLTPLPPQPADVPWPTVDWPTDDPDPEVDGGRLNAAIGHALCEDARERMGETHAILVVRRGLLIAERYAPRMGPDDLFPSWSMAKSILHGLIGVLVRDDRIDIAMPAEVPAWRSAGDPRGAITVDQLLRMSSGLAFNEDYADCDASDVLQMLFGAGKTDMAAYAADRPLAYLPDTHWNYSSGNTNIISGLIGRLVGGGERGYRAFMRRELFDPIGMRSAEPRFDAAGTFIGSSFVNCTARDFARFGLLYLRDGVWEGARVLPAGWVNYARTPTPTAQDGQYGAHFWLNTAGPETFSANGYGGQWTLIVPELDLVVVRLGHSREEQKPAVAEFVSSIVDLFRLPRRGQAVETARSGAHSSVPW